MRGNKKFPPYNKTSFVVSCERPLLRIIRVSARQKVFREQGSTCAVFPRYQRSLRSLVSLDFIGCFPDSSKQPGGGGRGKMKGGRVMGEGVDDGQGNRHPYQLNTLSKRQGSYSSVFQHTYLRQGDGINIFPVIELAW